MYGDYLTEGYDYAPILNFQEHLKFMQDELSLYKANMDKINIIFFIEAIQ